MGVYRPKDRKIWWMSFRHNGKQIRRSTKTTNKKLAEKIYAKVLTQITEGKWFDKPKGGNRTLEDLLGKYLREHSARNKVEKSHVRDKSLANHLKRLLGKDRVLDKVTPRLISEYKSTRREEGAAANTINNELRLLGHAFNLAMKEWEWVSSNPVARVSKEKVHKEIDRWMTPEEEELILKASPYWLQEIIVFAVNTGLRRGEILDLTWDRVDLARRTVAILEQKNKGKDTLPLNARAMEVLKARGKVRSISNRLVFLSKAGTALDPSNVARGFNKAVEDAGIEHLRFHDLRHTFATRMVQAGVDIYKVQKLMRHKTPLMTQRYAHHYPESLRDGVDALDRVITVLSRSKEKGATAMP